MNAETLVSLIKIKKIVGDIQNVCISHISQDSRDIKENTLFFCIEGAAVDGHSFVSQVSNKGVSLFIASKDISRDAGNIPVVYVKDTLKTMALLSTAFYGFPSEKLYMIGITGTNGKTTTSYLIDHILTCSGIKTGLIGTIHHKIGSKIIPTKNTTPVSITLQKLLGEMAENNCSSCVMEVSSHSLALDRVIGCNFDVAVFTNLSHEHLDVHKTLENYARTKELLFTGLGHSAKHESFKCSVVNLDDTFGADFISRIPTEVITYAIKNRSADFFADDITYEDRRMNFRLHFLGDVYEVKTNLIGDFNVYNVLAAIGSTYAKGLSLETIIKSLESFGGVTGRMQTVEANVEYKIIIDFAHTPDGLFNVLKTLASIPHRKIFTVIGHSGGNRDSSMRPALGKTALEGSDYVIFTADNPRNEAFSDIIKGLTAESSKQNYTVIEDRKEAIAYALSVAEKDDIVLLAGKGGEAYQVIGNDYIPYDELSVVNELLDSKDKR